MGLSFVACSRVRSLSDLAFSEYFDFNRLAKLANSPVIQEKIVEERRLAVLGYEA
ncbi:hypothetical protein RvY_11937 [Ramazzottius varieornatus]|uniref:Uncharacterized protein n=1 Tax=Ramazzottius varieornatus TaxID=947166 RepID=A0A1D1VN68_RAMVA|nr:hypothetical protein RvY_11937 [Ramazzottius varieornatus]